MSQDREEFNDRQRRRAELREKRIQEQKRLKRRLIAAAAILVGCAAAIYLIARDPSYLRPREPKETEVQIEAAADAETTPAGTEESTAPTDSPEQPGSPRHKPVTKIHIRATGDLNVTNNVVDSGKVGNKYDFTEAFIDVAALLSDADWTVMNFEGSVCGEPYGSETRSAPPELLRDLRNVGVDMIQTANSYSIYNGLIGMTATNQSIRNAGLIPLGTYTSTTEFQRSGGYEIVDIQGVKVAFVGFTKGLGGMGMPAGNEACVNLLYEDYDDTYQKVDEKRITKILRAAAAEKPDITIAMLHWGSEYNDAISKTQEQIVKLMTKEGVDVILGTHPHTVQKIDFDKSTGTLIAYSLGDFYGDASRAGTNYSIILDLEITKDAGAGTTKVTDFSYFPIYTLSQEERESKTRVVRQVMRIGTAMQARDGNFVDRINQGAYDSMQYALTRISDRVKGIDEQKRLEEEERRKNGGVSKKKDQSKKKQETTPVVETTAPPATAE